LSYLGRFFARLSTALSIIFRISEHPENQGRRLRRLALFLAWQVWQRSVKRPWVIKLCEGRRLYLHPHSVGSSGVLYYGLPERKSMRFVLDYLKTGDGFLDVGANVGVYSLLASSIPGVQVVAFEPASLAYERTLANVRLNEVASSVTVLPYAVGARSGKVLMTVDLDAMNHIVEDSEVLGPARVETVERRALDELTCPPLPGRVNLIKIDVEGLEADVLRGAEQLLSRDSPAIIVEANAPIEIRAALMQWGYQFVEYLPETRDLVPTDPSNQVHQNVIAVRDVELARARVSRQELPK